MNNRKATHKRDFSMLNTAREYKKETGREAIIVAIVDAHGTGSFSYINDRAHALNLLRGYVEAKASEAAPQTSGEKE